METKAQRDNHSPTPAQWQIFMSLPGSEALPNEVQIAVYNLDTFLHTVYDPFNDHVDWRGWMLGVCGRILDLSTKFPSYDLAIRHLLAQSVRNLALYDTRQAAPKGYPIAKLAETHPLLPSNEVPKDGIAYIECWDDVYLKRRSRLLAFIQLYKFLTEPDTCSTAIETNVIELPQKWLDHMNSFDSGMRKEIWGPISLWESHSPSVLATAHLENLPPSTSSLTPPVSVASLCIFPFTPPDLNELLVRLAVIDITGNCLTNDLRGKARGKRGAFTAAYRVLHRAGLLAPTATDREWATAFSQEYGAELGADVIAHKLTSHGAAGSLTPGPFQDAVDDATQWVNEWKSNIKNLID